MNALEICVISVISVEMENSADIDSHADFADLADFLFRYYYVCMNALGISVIGVISVEK